MDGKASSTGGGFMAAQSSETIQASLPFLSPRVLVRRMLAMAALWTLFGMVVGSALMPGDAIGVLSGAIAGALVLPWMGLFLGLLGGTVAESFVGGLAGALVAIMSGVMAGGRIDVYNLDLCLIMGGVMGANSALFLAARAWLRQQRQTVARSSKISAGRTLSRVPAQVIHVRTSRAAAAFSRQTLDLSAFELPTQRVTH
jgi:hypothetical protein